MRVAPWEQVYREGFGWRDDDLAVKGVCHYTVRPLPEPGKARYMAQTFRWTPHAWVDIPNREIVQAIGLEEASFALRNLPGGVETNADYGAIQWELLGNENTIRNLTPGDLDWFADQFMRPLIAHVPIPHHFIPGRWTGKDGNMANVNSAARLSGTEYDNYSGWLGHQNVPENDHTDGFGPGQWEYLTARVYTPQPPPSSRLPAWLLGD